MIAKRAGHAAEALRESLAVFARGGHAEEPIGRGGEENSE
jgi:hypothetical protein